MHFHQQPHTFVDHVELKVEDLERSLSFYEEMIGFQILHQSDRMAALTADGTTPLVVLEQPEHVLPRQQEATGLYHFALLLPNRSDLADVFRHLLNKEYPLQGASDHHVSEAIYLADPDGNGIEIYADRPPSVWQGADRTVDMRTERLDIDDLLFEGQGTWRGLPAETIMGHLHLQVAELHKTEEFYCAGLGFDVTMKYGRQALFVSTGGYHHHLVFNIWYSSEGAAPSEKNRVGLKRFSLIFPNEQERRKSIERLEQLGTSVWEKNGLILTKDPSGNVLQLGI